MPPAFDKTRDDRAPNPSALGGGSEKRGRNRLGRSTSPYLLQHAHNPVDWFEWGEEAFAEARRREVPIFLSIGYSTCYWCHVMERESFENPKIGRLLSERFVCIKVDREERPDVDDLYMQATLAVRGSGGWPMTCMLEPETLRPFWCGTYLPPVGRVGMPGIEQVIEGIWHAWRDNRGEVLQQAVEIAEIVGEQLGGVPKGVALGAGDVSACVSALLRMFDRTYGGFGTAPKFPQTVFVDLLLDAFPLASSDESREAIRHAIAHTLDRMAAGGIHDQVGGGFHRYAVDAHWTVPHFEKMVYDQALLSMTYAKASRVLGDAYYARVACRTLDYVLREMRVEGGGFASAQDAEVDGREGLSYLWTPDELRLALNADDWAFARVVYGVSRGPNFQDPHHSHEAPRSVLRLDDRPDRLGAGLNETSLNIEKRLEGINRVLLEHRSRRALPLRDDKAIASWNGLMVSALVEGYRVSGDRAYRDAAEETARFIRDQMGGEELFRVCRGARAHTPAFCEDYAMVLAGVVALAGVGEEREAWIEFARALATGARARFADPATGAWFDARAGQRDLFVRGRSTHDGAMPSAGSTMIHALLDLAKFTGEEEFAHEGIGILMSMSPRVSGGGTGACNSVRALLRVLGDPALRVALGRVGGLDADEPAPQATPSTLGEHVVEVYCGSESVRVTADEPGEVVLLVRIAPGFHVLAAEQPQGWEGGLVPMRVGVVGGTGLAAYADYPEGEAYSGLGTDPGDAIKVYHGEFELRVALECDGEWTGRPRVAIFYQACSDRACLAPSAVEIEVLIERG